MREVHFGPAEPMKTSVLMSRTVSPVSNSNKSSHDVYGMTTLDYRLVPSKTVVSIMKKRNVALLGALLVATLAAMPATSFARPGHAHGHKYGHGGSSVRFGLHIGVPLAIGAATWHYGYGARHGNGVGYYAPAPYYYYPPPTPIIVNPAPVTYIEQTPPVAASGQSNGYWYYCDGAKAYYPYVKECPAGWQPVPSTPNR